MVLWFSQSDHEVGSHLLVLLSCGGGVGEGGDDDNVDTAHLFPSGRIQVLFIINLIPDSCIIGKCNSKV